MAAKLQAKASDLAKAWSLVRSSDQRQMTIRVPSETFAKILALEETYPHRTRNEMVSDLLATALDDFVEGMPADFVQGDMIGIDEITNEPVYEHHLQGPRKDFLRLVAEKRLELSEKPGQESKVDLRPVDPESKEAA